MTPCRWSPRKKAVSVGISRSDGLFCIIGLTEIEQGAPEIPCDIIFLGNSFCSKREVGRGLTNKLLQRLNNHQVYKVPIMDFRNIEDIWQEFGLNGLGSRDLKKELTKLQATLHPDKYGGGDFASEEDKEKFLRIDAAIEFLEKQVNNGEQTALIPITAVNSLMEIVRELLPVDKSTIMTNAEIRLTDHLTQKIAETKSRSLYPRITVSAVTVTLTTVWLFPSIVKEHIILKAYFDVASPSFAYLWISSVVLTALIWYISKTVETQQKDFQSRLKTEIFQNQLFRKFLITQSDYIDWEYSRLKERILEQEILTHNAELSKEWDEIEYIRRYNLRDTINFDLVGFLRTLNQFIRKADLSTHLGVKSIVVKFTKDDFVAFLSKWKSQKNPECNDTMCPSERRNVSMFTNRLKVFFCYSPRRFVRTLVVRVREFLFGNPNEIDVELAQSLADIVFSKAEKKKLIVPDKQQWLSDVYVIE